MTIGKPIIIIIIIVAILGLTFGGIPNLTKYPVGWEIKTDIVGGLHEGTLYTADQLRSNIIRDVGPTGGGDPDVTLQPAQVLNAYSWLRFDIDNLAYGCPDIEASISDIRKKEGPFPYAELEKQFEDYTYKMEYVEYLFDLQVRTHASVAKIQGWGAGSPWYQHETAMPYMKRTNFKQETELDGISRIGKAFEGSLFSRFVVHPWGYADFQQDAPEDYTFTRYWAGIMNAKVENHEFGEVQGVPDSNHDGWVRGLPSDGSQLNMYLDDGSLATAYSQIPWDENKMLDKDIKSAIVVEIPFDVMAGAYEQYDPYYLIGITPIGGINVLKPVDVWFTLTVRVETFIVKEFYANPDDGLPPEPITPINPSPIQPPEDYVPVPQPSWFDRYGLYIVIIIIVLLIVGIFFMPYFGFSMPWLSRLFHRFIGELIFEGGIT